MFRTLPAIVAALALAACTSTGGLPGIPTTSPAPFAKTTVDDTALETAWRSFDLALDAIKLMPIEPGSAKGKAVAAGIRAVLAALTGAENAVAALSTTDYLKALNEAKAAIANLRLVLKSPSASVDSDDNLNDALADAKAAVALARS
jgi:hypothetical protein